jgi:uncharacterized membrane protein
MSEESTPREPTEEPPRDAPAGQPPPPSEPPPPPPPGGWPPPPGGYPPPPPGGYPPPSPGGWPPPGGYPTQGGWGQGYGQPGGYPPPSQGTSGLTENVASLLAYVLTWVTGLIFFLIDQRPEVRFHAMQSILFGVVWTVVGVIQQAGGTAISILFGLLWIACLILWVMLLINAYQGRHFKLPILGEFAEQQAQRPR